MLRPDKLVVDALSSHLLPQQLALLLNSEQCSVYELTLVMHLASRGFHGAMH